MREYEAYTDGSCQGNGKRHARAGVGVWFGEDHPLNYSAPQLAASPHTNQRAEIEACVVALRLAEADAQGERFSLHIFSDSDYTIKACTQWVKGWRRNGWRNAKKEPVKNRDLLEPFTERLAQLGCVSFTHVPSHCNIYGNEMADWLANLGAGVRKAKPQRVEPLDLDEAGATPSAAAAPRAQLPHYEPGVAFEF